MRYEINTIFLNAGLIDEMWLFRMPIVLGSGIPLFRQTTQDHWFTIHDIEEFDTGLVKRSCLKRQGI